MAFKQGEIYKCPDAKCGCELTVLDDMLLMLVYPASDRYDLEMKTDLDDLALRERITAHGRFEADGVFAQHGRSDAGAAIDFHSLRQPDRN